MEDLNQYRLDHLIIRETAERIIRDFGQFGIQIVFSGQETEAYDQLFSQLEPAFDQLLTSKKSILMQVLYRIDISEEKLRSSVMARPDVPLSSILAHLVIEREMQKSITRRYYKEKKRD